MFGTRSVSDSHDVEVTMGTFKVSRVKINTIDTPLLGKKIILSRHLESKSNEKSTPGDKRSPKGH